MVQHCNSCVDCSKQYEPYEPTALTCYLDNVSRKLDLGWTVVDDDIEYNETQLKIKNEKSETWNISSTILFVSYNTSCNQHQTFVCSEKKDGQMVNGTSMSVQFESSKL